MPSLLHQYPDPLAAGQRPARVRGIVLLDSSIVYGWRSGLLSVVKAVGQMDRVSPAAVAVKRCDRWPDLCEVHSHFAAKPMFARWHPEVLKDYIRHGTEVDPADSSGAGRRLKFRPAIEAGIYSTVPHRLDALAAGWEKPETRCPRSKKSGSRRAFDRNSTVN